MKNFKYVKATTERISKQNRKINNYNVKQDQGQNNNFSRLGKWSRMLTRMHWHSRTHGHLFPQHFAY